MCHFPTPKQHRELNLVAFTQKLLGFTKLDRQIMDINFRSKPYFLKFTVLGMAPRFLFLFLLLVHPFAIVHNTTDWRISLGRNLNQIKACSTGPAFTFFQIYNAYLLVICDDQTDRRNADLIIRTKSFPDFLNRPDKSSSSDGNASTLNLD